ncbi:Fc.00g044170.m01.CDS01 [Cosmosporella sp. VM-42]
MGGNNALSVNAPVWRQPDLGITRRGSDWYFTVCAVMGFSALVVLAWSCVKPQRSRIFHYITAALLAIATIAYFTMGAGLGQDPVPVEFVRGGKVGAAGTREIFYVRYIDWFCTTPLLLLDLLLTAGMPFSTIIAVIVADEIMIVCGLVGALTQTRFKWGFWTFGMAAFFYVIYALIWDGRRHANALGGSISRTYNMCGVLTIFVWFLYPIAWGVSEGGNVIHPDSEAVFYGILDLIAKVVFSFLLLWGHRDIDPAALGLHIREPGGTNYIAREKHTGEHGHIGGHNGVRDGVQNGTTADTTPAPAPAP